MREIILKRRNYDAKKVFVFTVVSCFWRKIIYFLHIIFLKNVI